MRAGSQPHVVPSPVMSHTPPGQSTSGPGKRHRPGRRRALEMSALVVLGSITAIVLLPLRTERRESTILVEKGLGIAEVAASASAQALAAGGSGAVQAVVDGAARSEGVVYVLVEDASGRLVAQHGIDRAASSGYRPAEPRADCPSCSSSGADGDVEPITVPLRHGTEVLGRLHLGLSRAPLRARVAEIRLAVGIVGLLALLLGALTIGAGAPPADATPELLEAIQRRDLVEESNRLLAAAMEQSAEILIVMDLEGVVQYVNPEYERVRGVRAEDIVGRSILPELSRELGDGFVHEVVSTAVEGPRWIGQIERTRADGTKYLQRTTVSPVRDPMGRIVDLVVVGQDVTREVELQDRLRQLHKMEAIGQLAGGVAHDFDGLVTALRRETAQLDTEELPGPVRGALERMSDASDRAATLTRQLLAFGRRQVLRPEPVLLDRLLREMAPILSGLVPRDTVIRFTCDAPPPRVVVDQSQLEQILIDLVLNARDAIDGTGEIVVSIERVTVSEAPRDWDAGDPDAVVRLAVCDDGRGIDPGHLDQVFEPFFTTKEAGEGVGLGLSTAYGVVRQSGGWLRIGSEPGRGTCVEVFLAEAHGGEESRAPAGEAREGARSVLVVDDEPLVRSLVRRYLERDGYEVFEAEDGDRAWALLNARRGEVALLLSDIRMPGTDGLTLARKASEAFPFLNILLMSGYPAEVAGAVGAADFEVLPKPFDRRALLGAVGEATGA